MSPQQPGGISNIHGGNVRNAGQSDLTEKRGWKRKDESGKTSEIWAQQKSRLLNTGRLCAGGKIVTVCLGSVTLWNKWRIRIQVQVVTVNSYDWSCSKGLARRLVLHVLLPVLFQSSPSALGSERFSLPLGQESLLSLSRSTDFRLLSFFNSFIVASVHVQHFFHNWLCRH